MSVIPQMKPIRIYRHHEWVGAGYFLKTLEARGIPSQIIPTDHKDAVARDPTGASGLVFLGAHYSVNDSFPWIKNELALIENAVHKGVPVLGHCFGAQLISKALGGTVAPMSAQEIGWYKADIAGTSTARQWLGNPLPDTPMLYWHKETFTLPAGSVSLMGTAFCGDQAFLFNQNVVATGAHPEVTPDIVRGWVDIYGKELPPPSTTTQTGKMILEDVENKIHSMRRITDRLYGTWITHVIDYDSSEQ